MKFYSFILFSSIFFIALPSCASDKEHKGIISEANVANDSSITIVDKYSNTEKGFLSQGLVDVVSMDSTIAVHLVYATPHNFMGKILYHDISHAFMLKRTADMLINANKLLHKVRPDLKLLVYDAVRPISIQREMWNLVKSTPLHIYVSDPSYGIGMHNFGAAVDVTLMDSTGKPLPMGSTYDYFGEEAKINHESRLLRKGRITQQELDNRLLLRRVMTQSGFHTYSNEWWHFNIMRPRYAKGKFKLIK